MIMYFGVVIGWILGGNKPYWNYLCPTCSFDPYVKLGLCGGIFESNMGNLKNGSKSCRCISGFSWTREQREYQIQNTCKVEGLTFIGWVGDTYCNKFSKFYWICSKGHKCNTSLDSFLNKGHRCFSCRVQKQKEQGNFYGYYPERSEEKDFLHIILFKKEEVIKVGRAFDVDKRLRGTGNNLLKVSNHNIDDLEVLKIFTAKHKEIYNTEQLLHSQLTNSGYHAYWVDWSTECFMQDSSKILPSLLEKTGLIYDESCIKVLEHLKELTVKDGSNVNPADFEIQAPSHP